MASYPGLKHRHDTSQHSNKTELETAMESKVNENDERKLIGIDGFWYDITDFISKHPGGPVIERFIGQDASEAFRSIYGHANALKYRKPVGTYKKAPRHPADEDFEKLIEVFKAKGWYETDWVWYSKKFVIATLLMLLAFVCVIAFQEWYMHYLGAVILILAWHQSGFLMHDFMHYQVFRDIKKDKIAGLFFGTFVFGTSSHIWHDEHNIHHLIPNTVDVGERFIDPQLYQSIWAQDEKLFPFFKDIISYCLIKIQCITYIPVTIFAGRIAITVGFYSRERRWYVIAAVVGHWLWMAYLLSHLPSWWSVFVFYTIVSSLEGILHFQLNNSHYSKSFYNMDEFHSTSWYVIQTETCLNVDNPWWFDWFHAGVNFHIEHHLYPRLGRKHLRESAEYVKAVCQKHNLKYDSCGFFMSVWKSQCHMWESALRFKLEYVK